MLARDAKESDPRFSGQRVCQRPETLLTSQIWAEFEAPMRTSSIGTGMHSFLLRTWTFGAVVGRLM